MNNVLSYCFAVLKFYCAFVFCCSFDVLLVLRRRYFYFVIVIVFLVLLVLLPLLLRCCFVSGV